jgi:putative spermidine/putrescine transport system substrate-binding protein
MAYEQEKGGRTMSTRRVIRVVLCFAVVLGLTVTAFAEEIVVCIWGGEFTKTERTAYFDPFEKETGITVKTVSFPEFAKIKAQVTSGNIEWDLVTAEHKWLIRGAKEGLFEPLDYSVIDTKDFLPDSIHEYGVFSEGYSHPIVYNTKKFSAQNHPRDWKDFWDVQKFPGVRSLYNNPAFSLEEALLADGVPPEKLYPLDVDRAFKSLDKIKPHIMVWYKNNSHAAQLMSQQEVDLMEAGHGRMYFIKAEGAPVGIETNQAIIDKSYWVVLKGSKHKATAMKLINYITRAKRQADWVNLYAMSVANKAAYDSVKPEIMEIIPTSPQNIKKSIWMNSEWWAENEAKMFERWNEWIMKK